MPGSNTRFGACVRVSKKVGQGLALACVAGFALAQAALPVVPLRTTLPEIEYGYPELPPRSFTNAQGQAEGQAIRMAKALFASAGIPWRASSYPARRLFQNLENGTTTFAVMVHSPALVACCLLNRDPLYTTDLKTYYIGDKPPINSRSDLIGKRIITIRGYSYSGLITFIDDPQNRITNEIAPTHESAFQMLIYKRADYVLNYDSPASVTLAAHPIANLRQDTLERVRTHIALSKSYPDAEKVMERFEVILKTINAPEFFKTPAK